MDNKKSARSAGYSGTPLAKKLGIKPGFVVKLVQTPAYYFDLFEAWPEDVAIEEDDSPEKDFIHFFTKERAELDQHLPLLREEIKSNGMIWVSWPKKASKVPTDITEDVIRAAAFAHKLVDVKVCAVDKIWSGLKLVIRKKDR
ncbi:MAG: DUF3052 family protein [Saprospiraceae bacterium]|nr:DUF3052 family protein [Saprospiraceae bacterium]